jgi:hypothetical protein
MILREREREREREIRLLCIRGFLGSVPANNMQLMTVKLWTYWKHCRH